MSLRCYVLEVSVLVVVFYIILFLIFKIFCFIFLLCFLIYEGMILMLDLWLFM